MEEMNSRDGGFMHEVQRKYNGRVFKLFSSVFDLWPIAAVIGGRVIVLHGGIPRKKGMSLQLLRNVACRRQVPQDPRNDEDQIFFDVMWNDPHEGNGLASSSRGDGCVAFGRDVCRAFLKRSNLGMLIRSHECPREHGVVEHHGGRTFTVFSASNYCGSMGNLGAIMIFNERMEFTPWEYMAPSLEEQEEMHAQGAVEAADARGLERVASVENAARQTQTMDEMIVAKLKQLIVERRTDLWWYYHHSEKRAEAQPQHLAGSIRKRDDPGQAMAAGHISPSVWRDGLLSVLQLQSVPLMSYRPQLAALQPDGSIDYNRFLNRYVLVQDDETQSGWQTEVVKELYEAVLRSDLSLTETIAFFDHDGDGRVTFEEFVAICDECELGITPHQAKQLLREIAHSSDGRGVDIADFIERFQVLYVGSSGHSLLDTVTEPWARELIAKVGRAIVGGGESAIDVFTQFDTDDSGFLECVNRVFCPAHLLFYRICTAIFCDSAPEVSSELRLGQRLWLHYCFD
jgi:diadenosine tetraphosphatase ApaH/serine/threonine PP2A family protein phosphatase